MPVRPVLLSLRQKVEVPDLKIRALSCPIFTTIHVRLRTIELHKEWPAVVFK